MRELIDSSSQNSKLVSVIIPAYNAASSIRSTIQSVVDQSYPYWEIVVADDASTDGTAEIVTKLSQSDSRIRLVHVPPENGLAARARNTAMQHAKGAFFALLDSDDRWTPNKLERQVEYLTERPEIDGVCSWYDYFGDAEAVALHNKLRNSGRSPELSNSPICERFEITRNCPFLTSTVMFRRRCYDELGGMDEDHRLRSGEDYVYFARLIVNFRFHRIREILTHYRVTTQASLSGKHVDTQNSVGWNIYTVLMEKGILTPSEARRKRGGLYYEQAKNNLFRLDAPFRRPLLRSVLTGAPPREAVFMLSLSFLPRWLLIATLKSLLSAKQKLGATGHKALLA